MLSFNKLISFLASACFIMLFISLPFSAGQDVAEPAEAKTEAESAKPYRITVNVSEVGLDVVVVDKKGNPITDLTADDFEVYQDKRQYEVTSGIYIENQAEPSAWPSASRNLPKLPANALKEEEVSRSIVFLLDDIGMNGDAIRWAKMSINNFLDKQMQSGDLVAVMRTSSGNSASDMFNSDKRLISAIAENVWGQGEFYSSSDDPLFRVYESQLLALSFSIQALKDMPGRKILFFLTSMITLNKPKPTIFGTIMPDYYEMFRKSYDLVADEAMRSGVVVHMMDTKGLIASETGEPIEPPNLGGALNPLPAKTGGLIVENANFFLDGIDRNVNKMIAGYYLVSYIPPSDTFNRDRYGNEVYHRVQVRVKRKDATVYTREGFYGRTESVPVFSKPANPLQAAIFSPFLNADINVNMAAGFTSNAKAGYVVRAWVHIDPNDVEIIETEDGGAVIKLDVMCLTAGAQGGIHDARHTRYTFNMEPEKKSENIELIRKYGIQFSLLLPVKKPGAYVVRIAVQDAESGKVGSAYQFVEVPDLKKKKMTLSDIFMITNDEDLAWMNSDVTKELSQGRFFPVMRNDETRSPALRSYMAGDNLQTLMMIYNADPKAIARSEIEMQTILYKDGVEFTRVSPWQVTAGSADNTDDGIRVSRKMTLGLDMAPGDYVLQRRVVDKKKKDNSEKPEGIFSKIVRSYINEATNFSKMILEGHTTQSLSFRIMENTEP